MSELGQQTDELGQQTDPLEPAGRRPRRRRRWRRWSGRRGASYGVFDNSPIETALTLGMPREPKGF